MRKPEKRLLRFRGAKHCLRILRDEGGDIREVATKLLQVPGMNYCLRDDHWAIGFVAMLKKKAGIDSALTFRKFIKENRNNENL